MSDKSTVRSEHGRKLTDLLIKAAGMDGKPVRSISCHCSMKDAITFDVTLMTTDEQVGAALVDVQKVDNA